MTVIAISMKLRFNTTDAAAQRKTKKGKEKEREKVNIEQKSYIPHFVMSQRNPFANPVVGFAVDGMRMIIKRTASDSSSGRVTINRVRYGQRDLEKQSSWYVRDRRKQILRLILSSKSGREESCSKGRRAYRDANISKVQRILFKSRGYCLVAIQCVYMRDKKTSEIKSAPCVKAATLRSNLHAFT